MTTQDARPVLVTGAAGFVGSHLVDALLARGRHVRGFVRRTSSRRWLPRDQARFTVTEGDLRDPASLRAAMAGVATVYHAAAVKGASSPDAYEAGNARGTAAVAEAALAQSSPPRVVYLSSLAALGPSKGREPVDEASASLPVSAYGRTKAAGEEALRKAGARLPWTIVRPPVIIGPRDPDLLLFFRPVAWGWIPKPAGAALRIAALDVEDVVEATITAAEHPSAVGRAFVLARENPTWEMIGAWGAEALGRRARALPIPRWLFWAAGWTSERLGPAAGATFNREKVREALQEWVGRGEAITRELGYTYRVPLREGVQRTVAWYREQRWL